MGRHAWLVVCMSILILALAGCSSSNKTPSDGFDYSDLSIINEKTFPSSDEIWNDIAEIDAMGPRLTGSSIHNAYLDILEQQLRSIGAQGIARDTIEIDRWTPHAWDLALIDQTSGQETMVPVANYFPYSGETPETGVIGELVETGVGIPLNVSGKIALCDAVIAPLTVGVFMALSWYVPETDPVSLALFATEDYRRSWLSLALAIPNLTTLQEQGAVGAVVILDEPYCMAKGEYVPFTTGYQGLPAVLVDRDTGEMFRELVLTQQKPNVRLTMCATIEKTNTYHLYGFLPGKNWATDNDEYVILNTHTDGQNAVEENGPAAILAIGKYFSQIPQEKRGRTLCFSLVTGHFQAQVPDSEDFIERHPEIMDKTVGSITIEHLGCVNWLETSAGVYENMERPEPGGLFVSNHEALINKCIDLVNANGLNRAAVLRGQPAFGVGAAFINYGIPAVGYLAGPTYLLNLVNGGMDKLDKQRLYSETIAFSQLTGWLCQVPKENLQSMISSP